MKAPALLLKLLPSAQGRRAFQQPAAPAPGGSSVTAPESPPHTPPERVAGRLPRRPPSRSAPRPTRRLPVLRLPRPQLGLRRPALWSRYTLGLVALLGLGLLVRLPLIWAAPLDAPTAPQAATAVFVRRLAAGADLKAALPWAGPLPTDPLAGLPLYAWLAALVSRLSGDAPWAGRAVAVLAALLATGLLYVVVRRLAGGRAALYAALFLTLAPPGLYYGRAYLPESLGWAAACGALAATLRWRDSILAGRPQVRRWLVVAAAAGGLAVLVAPANLGLLLPLLYLAWPHRRALVLGQVAVAGATPAAAPSLPASLSIDLRQRRTTLRNLRWRAYGFAALVALPLLLWWGLRRIAGAEVDLDPAYGGGGLGVLVSTLRQGSFYGLLAGHLVNEILTFAGLLLLLAGLGRPVRPPWPWAIHCWVLGGLLAGLAGATRLATDDAALISWLPALAALTGLGANWLATLPALVAAVLRGQEDDLGDLDADRADGVPTDEADPAASPDGRRGVRGAVRRAERSADAAARRAAAWPHVRTALLRLGNTVAILLLLAVFVGGSNALVRRYAVSPASLGYVAAGTSLLTTDPGKAGGRLVVAGPGAPEMFYASGLTGWAVPEAAFNRLTLDALKRQGATTLVSADQSWLGHQADYPGLLASFSVALLAREFTVFDLRNPPVSSDSHYFLQTGHTLRGAFWGYWSTHGGAAQFGYPLTDEIQETSPDDGQRRTVQYFERAIFELHPDQAANLVQLAPLGRRVLEAHAKAAAAVATHLVGVDPVPAAPNTPTYHYFPETGHSAKGEFLKYWQAHGGVALFGYPVSEELNEISPADGKVHIMQYFERARFEWHQEAAGTPAQVQLGLLGREWLEAGQP